MAKAPTLLYKVKEEIPVQSILHLDPAIKEDTVLTGTQDGTVFQWNVNSLRKTEIFKIGNVGCLGLKTLGNTLFTQDKLGSVKLWEPFQSSWTHTATIDLEYTGFAKIDVTKNSGGLVACPTKHSTVSIYSAKDCNKVLTLQREQDFQRYGEVMAVKFVDIAQSDFLLVGFESGHLELYDLKTKRLVSNLLINDCILSLDFHSISKIGLCGNVGKKVHAFKINDNMELTITHHLDVFNNGASVLRIIPHKKIVVTGGWDGLIRVFSMRKLNFLGGLTDNCSEIIDIDFSANLMTVADSSGKVLFWNV